MNGLKIVYRVPMRNWNVVLLFFRFFLLVFIACLWGIETYTNRQELFSFLLVYRVPMRNWNSLLIVIFEVRELSLSRAYEELKRSRIRWLWLVWAKFIACLWGIETRYGYFYWATKCRVYRVPMRNWNYILFLDNYLLCLRFIACLWGIETISTFHRFTYDNKFIACLWGIETEYHIYQ